MEMAMNFLRKNASIRAYLLTLSFSNSIINIYLSLIFEALTFNFQNDYTLILSTLCLGVLSFIVVLSFLTGNNYAISQFRIIGLFKLHGTGYKSILFYLFSQYFIITIISLVIGITGGFFVGIFVSLLFNNMITFHFKWIIIIIQCAINLFVILFMVFLSIGHIYKNDIKALLDYNRVVNPTHYKHFMLGFTIPYLSSFIIFLVFIFLIVIIPIDIKNFIMISICVDYFIIPKIINVVIYNSFNKVRQKYIHKQLTILSMAHTYNYLKASIYFVQLFIICLIVVLCSYSFVHANIVNMIVCYSSIILCLISLLLAFYYHMVNICTVNTNELLKLKRDRFSMRYVRMIVKSSIIRTIILYLALTLILSVVIGCRLVLSNSISIFYLIAIYTVYIIGVFLVFIRLYRRIMRLCQ